MGATTPVELLLPVGDISWVPILPGIDFRLLFTSGDKPKLDDETRRELVALFAEDVRRLELFLGRDLGALRKSW